jgi:hypothetical protein
MEREALKLALGYVERNCPALVFGEIKKALVQPAQEPVAQYSDIASDGGLDPRNQFDAPQRERVLFPTMLRKMWSGGEVQAWLDENVNKERNHG